MEVKKLEEAMELCLDKASRSNDSEEVKNYISESVKIANVIMEAEKNESVHELEERKYEESKWIEMKDLLPILGPGVVMLVGKVYDSYILKRERKAICYFEKHNTFTTQAGRGLGSSFRFSPIYKRDR